MICESSEKTWVLCGSVFQWTQAASPGRYLRALLIELSETNKFLYSYGYQLAGNGRWQSMTLKRPKKIARGAKRKPAAVQQGEPEYSDEDEDAVTKTQVTKNVEV